jgi:hypothetical protein
MRGLEPRIDAEPPQANGPLRRTDCRVKRGDDEGDCWGT